MTKLMTIDAQDLRVGDTITGPFDREPATVVSIRRKERKFRGKNGGTYEMILIVDSRGNKYELGGYSTVWVRR